MRILLEIWRYRRVWKQMIDLWEADCKRRGAITLQSGESVSIEMPLNVWGRAEWVLEDDTE